MLQSWQHLTKNAQTLEQTRTIEEKWNALKSKKHLLAATNSCFTTLHCSSSSWDCAFAKTWSSCMARSAWNEPQSGSNCAQRGGRLHFTYSCWHRHLCEWQFGNNKCANTFVLKQIQPPSTSQDNQEADSRSDRLTARTGARFADTPESTSHCSSPIWSFRRTAEHVDVKLSARPEKLSFGLWHLKVDAFLHGSSSMPYTSNWIEIFDGT